MIKFTKLHGIGNDFVFIEIKDKKQIQQYKNRITKISNRNFGIGCDGVIFILINKNNNKRYDAKLYIYNSDGSTSKMCGNALRCATLYLYNRTKKKTQNICIGKNYYICKVLKKTKDIAIVRVLTSKPLQYGTVLLEKYVGNLVNIGNNHCVIFVKNFNINFQKVIKELASKKEFSDGINVEFVKVVNNNTIRVIVFERGVGRTLGCGSGAICSAYMFSKINNNKDIVVVLDGGELNIKINNKIEMIGECEEVFNGEIND